MAIQLFNVGSPNTGTGLPLNEAFTSIQNNLTDLQGQINLIGDAVTEAGSRTPYIVYVATDGDDDNNGHSFAEPFATLAAAIEEAWAIHEAETNARVLIKVAPGNYTLSNLPYRVPAFTSIMGDALRAVFLYPATGEERNGFFKVDDAFYMWGLTFKGHQADSAKTGWVVQLDDEADNTGRGANSLGAYITASPYFQNCSSITAEDDEGYAPSLSTGDTGGGIYVNGNACASNSPLRSIVLDSFTQINLDGIGCLVENDGYAQLVSFFGTFCRYHVLCRTGGQVNFTGGTTDFGTYGLVADGYSPEPVYTAEAQRNHYGAARSQQTFSVTAGNLLTKAGHGLVNNALLSLKSASSKPIQPTLDPGERYYVVNATANTIQVAATVGGTPLVLSTDSAYTDVIEIVNQGELELDLVNFSQPRYGTAPVPSSGMLAFPVLVFPRTGSLAADVSTPGTVASVEQDGIDYTAVAVLDTAPESVGKHEYTSGTGFVTVTRPGAFVTPEGFDIPTAPVGGFNTYTFVVTAINYDHLTGLTKFKAEDYLPNALDSFYFTDCEFICPLSALTVLGSEPINQFGQGVPEGSPTAVGRQVSVYNVINGGLQYHITQGQKIQFRRRSQISAPSHVFEYVGSGTNYAALPENGGIAKQSNAYQELNGGKVFTSWTNEKGDFGVTNRFLVDGTTGEVTIDATSFNLSGLNAIGPFSRNGGFTTVGVVLREISNNVSMNSSLGFPGDDTVPTQEALVGYVTNILSGETQFEAIFINGVVIFAVGSTAEYPTDRPNGQPLQTGDILWDATAQDWVRYDGSGWNSEIKAIVRSDGLGGYITNYEFRTVSEPTIRPDGLAIQDNDVWKNLGKFEALKSGSYWLATTERVVSLFGYVSTTTNWTAIRTSLSTYSIRVATVTNNTIYYNSELSPGSGNGVLYSSVDKGNNWSQVFPTQLPTAFDRGDIYLLTPTAVFFGMSNAVITGKIGNLYRSTDNGVTWSLITIPPIPYVNKLFRLSDGRLLCVPGLSHNDKIYFSTNLGDTWTRISTPNTTFTTDSFVILNNGTWVAYTDSTKTVRYSTDEGINWSLGGVLTGAVFCNTGNLFITTDGTNIYWTDGTNTYSSSDYGVTPVQIFNGQRFIVGVLDDGTYVEQSQFGHTLSITPAATSFLPGVPTRLDLPVQVNTLNVTYSLRAGAANNHDASNFYTVNVSYVNVQTGTETVYSVSLNSPYPSTTLTTVSTTIDEASLLGATVAFDSVTSTGTPSPIDIILSLRGQEIYV